MPRCLLTTSELEGLPRRARNPAFRPAVERLRCEAAAFAARKLVVPELPGGYYHDYICPHHGVELRFDPHSPTEHRCPVDLERFSGEKYDAAWRWFANHHLAEGALRLAVLWRAEGDASHRETVRGILLGYAERYAFYGTCARTGINPGVATYTTLDESVWIIPLAWAFSLLTESLAADESDRILNHLLVPAAEHLVRRRYGAIHNFTCWHNAAIATVGRLAGRDDLLAFALNGDLGQRAQLQQGMLGDGLWFEGSMSYHFYSVWAILMSAIAFRHDPATELASDPAVRRSLLAPLACAYPDGTLPATNDCWYFTSVLGPCCHGVPPAPDFFEIAYGLLEEPAFAATLQRVYRTARRDSVYALLLGVEQLPDVAVPARASVCLPESGLAILRPNPEVDLMLKFGPHGGHHGHPDKLSLTGWAYGWRFSPDLGTPGYGVASLETWYRQTLSHNTVVIDGVSQPPAQGRLVRFERDAVSAEVDWEGVTLRRSLTAKAEYFIDIFAVACAASRQVDWVYHNAGLLQCDAPAEAVTALAGGEAYAHLVGVRRHARAEPMTVTWSEHACGLRLWLPSDGEEQVFTGKSPANPPSRVHGFVLRRRQVVRTVFVAVFHPFREAPRVRSVDYLADGGIRVELSDRVDRWTADQLMGD